MENNQLSLVDSKTLRQEFIDRVDILEKVKELLLLGKTGFGTLKQVAEFYEVKEDVLYKIIERNKDELISDGFKVYTRKTMEDFCSVHNVSYKSLKGKSIAFFENEEIMIGGRGISLFTKRSILRVGMLLRDSIIAKNVRNQLLNIEENASVKIRTKSIDEEQAIALKVLYGETVEERLVALSEFNEIKNNKINVLTLENKALSDGILKWDNRSVINKLVRRISMLVYSCNYVKGWEKLWGHMYYKHHIHVKVRIKNSKIKRASMFDVLDSHEILCALKSSIALCEFYNIEIDDIMMEENIGEQDMKYIDAIEDDEVKSRIV